MKVSDKIRRGMSLLDEKVPGWRERIDLDTLDMHHNCILKQLFGNYREGLAKLGLGHKWAEGIVQSDGYAVSEYGFTILCDDDVPIQRRFVDLTARWKRQLGGA